MIDRNPQLTLIRISATVGFTGSITIKDNENLEKVELLVPSITTTQGKNATGLIIENNPKLGSIDMQKTNLNMLEGKITMINNKELTSLDFSNATQFIVNGG